ncbi:MAG: LamG-like jellyroll fold domain-containing protein, partial [Verrucomicrobiota bacterium]|nr:LamG-like jellyroll fold domain-containing protein [Verrucomicrobiota bacterium]
MKSKIKLVVFLFTAILAMKIYAGNKPVLDLDFKKYSPVGTKITGGEIIKTQRADALIFDKTRKRNFIHFNGRNETLQIGLSDKAQKVLKESFTLEFDFFSPKLPADKNYREPGIHSIEIFSALGSENRPAMRFYMNQYKRFTLYWFNSKGKRSQILTTWNHKNYEVTSVRRGKWYTVAIVYNHRKKLLEIYLDGEKLGSTKTSGNLQAIKQFRFGGNLKRNRKGLFTGGVDKICLYDQIFHDKETDAIAQKKSWKRLHKQANEDLKSLLLPEDPKWANHHPRMILTPARIKIMKANLKKGKGPELVKKLIARCDEMLDPNSVRYVKEIPKQAWGFPTQTQVIQFPLATILTGDEKYAKRAIKLVMDYTEKKGYYDVFNSLYASGEGMTRQLMVVVWTYDWAYKYFTLEQRQKVRLFLLNIAKGTYTFYNGEVQFNAQRAALSTWGTNWTAMSIAALGNSSLAIMGETKGLTKLWLDYASFRAAQYGLFTIGKEGCFYEMANYFAYGAGPILPFMEALYTAGGDDLFMETNFSKYPNTLPYFMYPYSRKVMSLKFSSSTLTGLHGSNSYVMAILRQRLHNKQVEWCWQHLHENQPWADKWNLFSIIWFKPEEKKVLSPDLPLAQWFKTEGVVAFRSDWTRNAIAGVFMAYPAKMGVHDQSDRGQFTLYGYQGRWIIDNGGRSKLKFSLRNAHNLITVDNKIPYQKARLQTNFHHDAFITDFCTEDSIMTAAIADLTQSYKFTYTWGHEKRCNSGGYEDPFKNANRKLLYMREKTAPPYLLVYDCIQKDDKKHNYTLNLHTAPENEVNISENNVEFKQYPSIAKNEEVNYLCWPGERDEKGYYYYKGSPYDSNPKFGYAEYKINIPKTGKYNLYGFA